MESTLEMEARAALADRLGGARRDVVTVIRYLDCCPVRARAPIVPVLLAACDCLDEALMRLGRDPPEPALRSGSPFPAGGARGPTGSAALDEPLYDRQ
jgi:hypothetical protein